jgi:SAM-dependent methyltransferase
MTDYRNLEYGINNLETYHALTKKVKVISNVSKKYFFGKLLDIGCGVMPYKDLILESNNISEYVGVDIENPAYQKHVKPDIYWDGKDLPIDNNVYNSAMLIEVLEHVPKPDEVLKEVSRVLKNEGVLLITVPFLWPLHDVPHDEYRYTPFALKRLLDDANFEVLEMEVLGGWHASMATMLALYIRRGMRGSKNRKILSLIAKPIVKYLHKKDEKVIRTSFNEGPMMTGLWCLAKTIK